jgi:hypothetical protein
MPRIEVTEEEKAAIEKWRFKNATDLGFNEGIKEASDLVRSIISEHSSHTEIVEVGDQLVASIAGLKRVIKL